MQVFVDGVPTAQGRFIGDNFKWMNNTFGFSFHVNGYDYSPWAIGLQIDNLSARTLSGGQLYETSFTDTTEFNGGGGCIGDGVYVKDGALRFPSDWNFVDPLRPTSWQTADGLNVSFELKTYSRTGTPGFYIGLNEWSTTWKRGSYGRCANPRASSGTYHKDIFHYRFSPGTTTSELGFAQPGASSGAASVNQKLTFAGAGASLKSTGWHRVNILLSAEIPPPPPPAPPLPPPQPPGVFSKVGQCRLTDPGFSQLTQRLLSAFETKI